MYRSSPARKYGPLAAIAAAQLVVVLVAPSTAPPATSDSLGTSSLTGLSPSTPLTPDAAAAVASGSAVVLPDGSVVATNSAQAAAAGLGGATATGPTSTGQVGPTTAANTATGTTRAPGTTATVAGDTTHCVAGRQFDPTIEFFAPPCVPGMPGAAAANPGATSLGVTKDAITVVHYIPDYGAEVNAILRAQGLFYDASNARIANASFQKFMNTKYNLYGRKINIQTFQGTCRTVPPDQQCLNAEMNRIAKEFKPYAVFFQTTVCSACYAELARNKIVTFGGAGFSEEFRNALKPYNYDYGMSSSKMSKLFAQWWCGSLAGKPAAYAGGQNAAQDFRKTTRQLGVVSTNDPDNEQVIKKVLYPELAKCGQSVKGHEYFYEQNVATAAQQSQAGTAVMNSPQNPATSVVCFCDPVAPQFSYNAATNNNYWPETMFATNQSMDTDSTGQTYMADLACPQRSRGCAFDGALGLGQSEKAVKPEALGGIKVFKAGSTAAVPLQPAIMEIFWQNYNMFASLLQAAGPDLTPGRMAQTAPTLGSRGGGTTGFSRREFSSGELSWTQDVLLTYWTKNKTSPYNNVKGAFTQAYGGRRFGLGQIPTGNPAVPTVDKRG
ncbi:MAG: hypothetical protein H7323_02710 [Frankiales bacterium]|nr:hypothetical protein [Frankiales bacterium]